MWYVDSGQAPYLVIFYFTKFLSCDINLPKKIQLKLFLNLKHLKFNIKEYYS